MDEPEALTNPETEPEICDYVETDVLVALNDTWEYVLEEMPEWNLPDWNLPKLSILDRIKIYNTFVANRK